MAKIELALLVGDESKKWLAKLEKQLDRLEKLQTRVGSVIQVEVDEDTEVEEDEDDEDVAPPKKSKKAAKSFDEDDEQEEEADVDEDDSEDDDEEVEEAQDGSDDEDAEDDEEEPKKGHKAEAKPSAKKGKAKKVTIDDCNDAAKALCLAWGGKSGRPKVLKFMKKHFKVESVQDLKPEQYAAFVAKFEAEAGE